MVTKDLPGPPMDRIGNLMQYDKIVRSSTSRVSISLSLGCLMNCLMFLFMTYRLLTTYTYHLLTYLISSNQSQLSLSLSLETLKKKIVPPPFSFLFPLFALRNSLVDISTHSLDMILFFLLFFSSDVVSSLDLDY